jgi:ribonuclease Z
MRLQLLGTGTPAPLPQRQGSAAVVSIGHDRLVFDAGRGVTTQLVRAGIAPNTITAIFLTHHHYDHIGNLGDLILTAWHAGLPTLPIIGPPGTDRIVTALLDQVYDREIAFSLALARARDEPIIDIHEVVTVTTITSGQTYHQGSWRVIAAAVEHGHRLGLSQGEWPCLGYRIEAEGKSIVMSGDTVACDSLVKLAHNADVLVQCCYLAEAMITTPARQLLAEQVIASSGQVGKIAAQAGVKTLVLTHFSDMPPEMFALIAADVRRDFAGLLYLGEDLLELEV